MYHRPLATCDRCGRQVAGVAAGRPCTFDGCFGEPYGGTFRLRPRRGARLKLLAFKALRGLSRVPGFRKMAQELMIHYALKTLKYDEWRADVKAGAVEHQKGVACVKRTTKNKQASKAKKARKRAKKSKQRNR